jgi:hypothetical protein
MSNQSIDYRTGWRMAEEMLSYANPVEVMVCADAGWKARTANNLIAAAESRKAEGLNAGYQAGVIARAQMELDK